MLKLSFILPCYNVAPYVGRCLESIEQHEFPQDEFEVICVDDCSTDNTIEVIKEYQKRYPNIQLFCHAVNKTAGGARNTGIDAAKGEYLWFVDPDDVIISKESSKLYAIAKEKDLDILVFNYSVCTSEGEMNDINQITDDTDILSGPQFFLTYFPQRRMNEVITIWRQLYKRSFCVDNSLRYPEIKHSQDVVFAWTASLRAERMAATPINAYICYQRPHSTNGTIGGYKANNVFSESILFATEIRKLLDDQHMLTPFQADLNKEIKYSINCISRKVIRMPKGERYKFHELLRKNAELVYQFHDVMNRKTKMILNPSLPYWLWSGVIIGYKWSDSLLGKSY